MTRPSPPERNRDRVDVTARESVSDVLWNGPKEGRRPNGHPQAGAPLPFNQDVARTAFDAVPGRRWPYSGERSASDPHCFSGDDVETSRTDSAEVATHL
jgi:hypothetical protein